MTRQNVDILVNAKNQSKRPLSEVDKSLERNRASAEALRKKFDDLGKRFKSVGQAAQKYLTLPIAGLAAGSIALFDKQAKAIAQVEAGLRSTGEGAGFTSQELQKMASDLQNISRFGDEDILQNATAQFLTFTNITGDQFERVQVASLDLATRLGGDLKSASIQLGKALNDPVANLSALSRSGIQFSEDQKLVIKQLAETNRLADAQTIILDELEKQYGGSAEAAAQAGAGGIVQLKNNLGDLMEQFGSVITQAINPIVKSLNSLAIRFKSLSEPTKRTIIIISAIVAAIGPLLVAIGAVVSVTPLVVAGITAIGAAISAMLGPILLVVAGVAALRLAWQENFLGMRDFTLTSMKVVGDYVRAGLNRTIAFFQLGWAEKVEVIKIGALGILKIIVALGKDMLGNIVVTFKNIGKVLSKGLELWAKVGDKMVTFLVGRFSDLADWISNFSLFGAIQKVGNTLLSGIAEIGKNIAAAGARIFKSFKDALKGDFSGFDLSDLFFSGDGTSNISKKINEIASSDLAAEVEGLQKSIAGGFDDILSQQEYFENTKKAVSQLGNDIDSILKPRQLKDTALDVQATADSVKNLALNLDNIKTPDTGPGGGGGSATSDNTAGKEAKDAQKEAERLEKEAKRLQEEINQRVESLTDKYKDLDESARDSLKSLTSSNKTAIDAINEKVKELSDSLEDLGDKYKKNVSELDQGIGESIVNQEKKIADLRKQLSEEDDTEKKSTLSEELKKEEEALKKFSATLAKETPEIKALKKEIENLEGERDRASRIDGQKAEAQERVNLKKEELDLLLEGQKGFQKEIAEARRRDSLTEFERFIEDQEKKRKALTDQYEIEKKQIEQSISLQEEKSAKETQLFNQKKQTILDVISLNNKLLESTNNSLTTEVLDNYESRLEALSKSLSGVSNQAIGEAPKSPTEEDTEAIASVGSNSESVSKYKENLDQNIADQQEHHEEEAQIHDKKQETYSQTGARFVEMKDTITTAFQQMLSNIKQVVTETESQLARLESSISRIRALTAPKEGPDLRTDSNVYSSYVGVNPFEQGGFRPINLNAPQTNLDPSTSQSGSNTVNFGGVVVRNDQDIEDIAEAVGRVFGANFRNNNLLGTS